MHIVSRARTSLKRMGRIVVDELIRVMVIDDEIHIRRLIDRMLIGRGFEVVGAGSGKQALALLRNSNHRPHVVTCDVAMPDMNGFEILEAIKADPDLCDIPVIMLTAMGQTGDAYRAKEMGAADYITKPFSTMSLIDILHQYAEKQ